MIPLTTLYNDYIDRPKLTEQKNPFEYIVPPPLKWVGSMKQYDWPKMHKIPENNVKPSFKTLSKQPECFYFVFRFFC